MRLSSPHSIARLEHQRQPKPGRQMTFIAYFPQKAKNVSATALLDHLEIFLSDPAIGTLPVGRHILPASTKCNSIVRPAFSFVINEAA